MPCTPASPARAIVVDEDMADPSFFATYQTTSPPCQFIVDGVQRAIQGRMTMNFKHEDQVSTVCGLCLGVLNLGCNGRVV